MLACFDDTRSWGLVAAVPVGVLTGLAFAMPIAAWIATRQTDNSFSAISLSDIVSTRYVLILLKERVQTLGAHVFG